MEISYAKPLHMWRLRYKNKTLAELRLCAYFHWRWICGSRLPESDWRPRLTISASQKCNLCDPPCCQTQIQGSLSVSLCLKQQKHRQKKTPSSNSNCATVNSGSVADGPVLEHHDSRRPPPSFQNKQLLWRDCAQSTGTAYYCLLCVQDDTLPCAHELGTQQFILTPHADMMHYNMGSLFLLSFFFGINEKNNRFLPLGGNKRSERSIIKSAATFFFSINC